VASTHTNPVPCQCADASTFPTAPDPRQSGSCDLPTALLGAHQVDLRPLLGRCSLRGVTVDRTGLSALPVALSGSLNVCQALRAAQRRAHWSPSIAAGVSRVSIESRNVPPVVVIWWSRATFRKATWAHVPACSLR